MSKIRMVIPIIPKAQARAAAVQWVTYDGTPETLPPVGEIVLWANPIEGCTDPAACIELALFFAELDRIPFNRKFPVRHLVLPVFFRLLYGCGLRPFEARCLLIE